MEVMMALAVQHQEAPRRAADHLVDYLVELGIDRVFGIPGGAISPVFDALVGSSVEVVVCQHEGMAAYQAYGYARATGRPGVILCTAGPGVLNALPGVAAAYHDEVPLLVLAGDVRTDFVGRGVIQDGGATGLDIESMLTPITRFRDRLTQPERILSVLDAAISATLQHPRGPALLQLPVDQTGASVPSAPSWRLHERDVGVDIASLVKVARLLEQARRPALLLGVGAERAGIGPLVERLAARLRVPVILDLEARGVMPESSPLCLGGVGIGGTPAVYRYLEQGVDVLVAIGSRLDDTTTGGFGETLRPTEALVQIDHDPLRLGRAWPADVAVHGDLRDAIETLEGLCVRPSVSLLLARDEAIRDARPPLHEATPPLGESPFDPRSVVEALQSAFGPDAIFTSDIGNHLLFAAAHLSHERPGAFHVSLGLGGMGSGIGCAMGIATAESGARPVVGICGDGSLLMVGNELATCAKYRVPVVLAVLDNRELGMVRHGMERHYGRVECCEAPPIDVVAYAQSLGAEAVTIRSRQDLVDIAQRPIQGPVVLHFQVDAEVRASNPRESGFEPKGAARG